jgi:multiple sugar transport system permease protein
MSMLNTVSFGRTSHSPMAITAAVVKYLVILAGAFIMVFPFYWMILNSLREMSLSFKIPPLFYPTQFKWQNYVAAWTVYPYGRAYVNTFIVTTVVVVLSLLTTSLAAYVFAKMRFAGKRFLFPLFLATMMIPFQVTMIPVYLIIRALGLYNSLPALIIPSALFNASGVFFLRQFIRGVPGEYNDSAYIDGAGYFRIYRSIMLPLIKTALVSQGIFIFIGVYNDFLMPLILLRDFKNFTVPILLAQMKGIYYTDIAVSDAAAAIAVVPVLVIYVWAQRYIIEGIALTGLKA